MRNYVQTFWKVITATLDDGMNPPSSFDFKPFGGTLDELHASEATLKQNVIDTSPGFTVTFATRIEDFPAWFLFDKENISKMMNVIRDFFFDQCIMDPLSSYAPISPDNQLLRVQLEKTPRQDGWTDSSGNKRTGEKSQKANRERLKSHLI